MSWPTWLVIGLGIGAAICCFVAYRFYKRYWDDIDKK